MKQSRLLTWLEKLELALYRSAERVVVVTEAFKHDLVERGIDAAKIAVVTNGANLGSFSPRPKDAEIERRLGLAGKTVVAYIGTHGMAHGLDFIIDCAAELRDANYHFLFVGAGAERQATIDRARSLGLDNCTFLEPVPKAEITRYIATSDVMLVPLRKSDVFKTVIPSKIFEAAVMERPILLGVDGEARAIVERFGAGRFFEPEDKASFIAALAAIAPGDAEYQRMQDGCRALAGSFDRSALAARMLEQLELAAKR